MRRHLFALAVAAALLAAGCGGGAPATTVDARISTGAGVYSSSCSVCHGDHGQGGVGRPLETVTSDFPDCSDLIKWITIGSSGWKAQVGDSLGASDIQLSGSMPAFEDTLSSADIAEVAVYVRVRFGGESPDTARAACGL